MMITENEFYELKKCHPLVANELIEFGRIHSGQLAPVGDARAIAVINMHPSRMTQFAAMMNVQVGDKQTPMQALISQGDQRARVDTPYVEEPVLEATK